LRGALLAWALLLSPCVLAQSALQVRYPEGLLRGFLVLRAMDGKVLANGDFAQVARGERVTSRLVLRFKDQSIHEETVSFSQRGQFQLLSYRLVQKGPAFRIPLDMTINRSTGEARVRYTDEDGNEKEAIERFELPPDLMNGMVPVLLKNIPAGVEHTTVSLVAAAPEPRLVKLEVSAEGKAKMLAGGASLEAARYRLRVEIGGISGVLAQLAGMQPQDSHAWVVDGGAPAIVRIEGPLYLGGPSWRIEPASPEWQQEQGAQ
jgi:hypothetical protein